jgi:tetratricopeptide (TPR) repeat protein
MIENANRIVFIPLPESLRDKLFPHEHAGEGHRHGERNFVIEPGIPFPAEIPPGEERFDPEKLSSEMILAGMLRVISAGNRGEAIPDSPEFAAGAAGRPRDEWIDYYRRFVLALRPGIFGEFNEAAIFKARNGDFGMALELLDCLLGLFPQSPAALLNRALVLEEAAEAPGRAGETGGELRQKAEAAYEKVLALDPPFPDGFFNAAYFFMKDRDFRRAGDCFSTYLSLTETAGQDEDSADREKRENAAALLGEIRENGLDDDSFQEACGFIRGGREEQALESIRLFLERHPRVSNGWFILGWALRRLERWEDGAGAFRKALELGSGGETSSVPDIRNELAICLMELGDYRDARRQLELSLREAPEDIKIISNLGVLAMRQGRGDEAAGFFRTVLELAPDDPVAAGFFKTGSAS